MKLRIKEEDSGKAWISCGFPCNETKDKHEYYLWQDGTLQKRCGRSREVDGGWYDSKEEADNFLRNWVPQSGWIDKEVIKLIAQRGDKEALLASITHWKQIVMAGPEEFWKSGKEGKVSFNIGYCALCQRYIYDAKGNNNPCQEKCPLKGCDIWVEVTEDLFNNKIDGAINLLNKLITVYKNLYQAPVEPGYIFKKGDVIECSYGPKRLITGSNFDNGELIAVSFYGNVQANGQKQFEELGYKKVGTCTGFNF